MTLPPLSVLMYTPAESGAAPRLVDVGESLDEPAGQPAHGRYHVKRLLTWRRAGARFDVSRTGGIRVWTGRQLTAAERGHDGREPSAPPLEPDDLAYLEAYLLRQNRRWTDLNTAEDPFADDAHSR